MIKDTKENLIYKFLCLASNQVYCTLHTLLLLSFVDYKFHNLSRIQTLKHLISNLLCSRRTSGKFAKSFAKKEEQIPPARDGRPLWRVSHLYISFHLSPSNLLKFAWNVLTCFYRFTSGLKHPTRLPQGVLEAVTAPEPNIRFEAGM